MESSDLTALVAAKSNWRTRAYEVRRVQKNKDAVSEAALKRFVALDAYRRAITAMWYVHCRSELRTMRDLAEAVRGDKRIVVPYCTVDENGDNTLGLWHLQDFAELTVGKWEIFEPPSDRWGDPASRISPHELDVVMVPGVAFARDGSRLGNGQGYYDRLLQSVRADCQLIGVCYESQLFDDLPVAPHDVFMDKVVTEAGVYDGRGRTKGSSCRP